MTIGRGRFGTLNLALLVAAALGVVSFLLAEARAASPLIRLETFRDAPLSASLATNGIVATVMMATLVVGPFFLARGLGLNEAIVGATMSVGPTISIMSGIPAGRVVDRLGTRLMIILGLAGMACGAVALAVLPARLGVAGYLAAIIILTPGYQLFQAANNTSVMRDIPQGQRGVIAGMLSLSRNLGLITGASVMGAVFAGTAGTSALTTAARHDAAAGMQVTFAVAAVLIAVAIAIALGSRALAGRR